MCRGVIHDIRLIRLEQPVNFPTVSDRSDQHLQIQFRIFCYQLLFNVISIVFINIKNNQPFWLMPRDLPSELASNRPAASGDEYRLAF